MMQWIIDFLQRGDAAGLAARATIVAAFVALVGVIIATLVTLLNARRSLYVGAVTAERSKWINSLRENISTFSGKLRTLSYLMATGQVERNQQEQIVSEVNKLISMIRLQLNPFGEIDSNILRLLERMPALAEKADPQRISSADDLLIKHSQWLLKAEWEKVKYETRGIFLKLTGRLKARCHLIKYRAFARGDGNLERF
jgi:hypothetical protein